MIIVKDIQNLNDDEAIKEALKKAGIELLFAVKSSIENSHHSKKMIAAKMGIDKSNFSKWIPVFKDEYPSVRPNADRIPAILFGTERKEIINFLCHFADCFPVENSMIARFMTGDFTEFSKVLSEFADVTKEISEAFEDGRITNKETLRIRKEWEELKAVGEAYILSLEEKVKK